MTLPSRDLLEQRIAESGMSVEQWAKRVVLRDPRRVRAWLKGEQEVPPEVVRYLEDPEQAERDRTIGNVSAK